jgi:eukaryotic-like serine/threonine-protein kinase
MPKHRNRTVLTKQNVLIIIGILLIGVSVLSLFTEPGLGAVSGLLGALLTVTGLFDKKQSSAGSAMLISDEHGQQARNVMLGRVKSMWLNYYEVTVRGPALLRLTFQYRQDAINRPWEGLIRHQHSHLNQLQKAKSEISDMYDEAGGAILILGAPGSGKTTALLQLTSNLVSRAEGDNALPIPILFMLSTWAKRRLALSDWLAEELHSLYKVPKATGKAWIDTEQIIPLLDGLDEVPQSYRSKCVDAINLFRQEHGLVRIAVTSRTDEYEQLNSPLDLHVAVVIQPLTQDQIDGFLADSNDKLRAIRVALSGDTDFKKLLETPLVLQMLKTIAEEISEDAINVGSVEERQGRLIDYYVTRMIAPSNEDKRYTPEQILIWLKWLAEKMVQHNYTVFYVEQLQPDWTSTQSQRLVYDAAIRLITGVIGSIAGCLGAAAAAGLIIGLEGVPIAALSGCMAGGLAGGIAGGTLIGLAGVLVAIMMSGLAYNINGGFALGLLSGFAVGFATSLLTEVSLSVGTFPRSELRFRFIGGLLSGLLVAIPLLILLRQIFADPITIVFGVVTGIVLSALFVYTSKLIRKIIARISPALIRARLVRTSPTSSVIDIADTIGWSWSMAAIALLLGSPVVLLTALSGNAALGLLVAMAIALMGGISRGQFDMSLIQYPNQGIWRSGQYAIRRGLMLGLIVGITAGVFAGPVYGVAGGLASGLTAMVAAGGLVFIEHFVLRVVLYKGGFMPKRYVDFLDYASGQLLLRKIGGGYKFIHGVFQDHFAKLDL